MTELIHLSTEHLNVHTPLGRSLFEDLNVKVNYGERVAIVGRNGTGKSTLLRVLQGDIDPTEGRVRCTGSCLFVPQLEDYARHTSPGERRRELLERAFAKAPHFLLLDEPSLDLDQAAVTWLQGALIRYEGACLMVSHDRRLLRTFADFFVVSESGCHHHHGCFDSLLQNLSERHGVNEKNYARRLHHHLDQEAEHVRIARGRERKQNLGRVRELKRCPARARLNAKRSYAQRSQTRRAQLQEQRIGTARDWVKAVRRALQVQLPVEVTLQNLPPASVEPIIEARELAIVLPRGGSTPPINLILSRERCALTGPNGCGKSTLLEGLLGQRQPLSGKVRVAHDRVGYIAQNAANWQRPRSLLEELCDDPSDMTKAAEWAAAHRFPVALAERPLASLSPGERVRAALLALCTRSPTIELLILDEPTNHLDVVGLNDLERVLRAWPGGLLVVSHDREFLHNIGVCREMCYSNHSWRVTT
jgi:ATPase subunit of ABC transporter with duplicated ATPase domains